MTRDTTVFVRLAVAMPSVSGNNSADIARKAAKSVQDLIDNYCPVGAGPVRYSDLLWGVHHGDHHTVMGSITAVADVRVEATSATRELYYTPDGKELD